MAVGITGTQYLIGRTAQVPPTAMTIYGWFRSTTSGNYRNIARLGTPNKYDWYWNNTNNDLIFRRTMNSTPGVWRVTAATHGLTPTNWNFIAVTYDGASMTNDPTWYWRTSTTALTKSTTQTEDSTPVGGVDTTTGDILWGNTVAGSFPITGAVANVGLHNVMLNDAELAIVAHGGLVTRGLMEFRPYWSTNHLTDIQGYAGTVGAGSPTTEAHPPLLPTWMPRTWGLDTEDLTPLVAASLDLDVTGSATPEFTLEGTILDLEAAWTNAGSMELTVQGGALVVVDGPAGPTVVAAPRKGIRRHY